MDKRDKFYKTSRDLDHYQVNKTRTLSTAKILVTDRVLLTASKTTRGPAATGTSGMSWGVMQ